MSGWRRWKLGEVIFCEKGGSVLPAYLALHKETDQWPCSLASFLTRYATDIFEPECDLYVPPEATNNDRPPVRKAVGSDIDWENDPPF